MDSLHQKQKGRSSLEERLSQARNAKNNHEHELERKRSKCDVEIDEDFLFPSGGDEEINLLIQQSRSLQKELQQLSRG